MDIMDMRRVDNTAYWDEEQLFLEGPAIRAVEEEERFLRSMDDIAELEHAQRKLLEQDVKSFSYEWGWSYEDVELLIVTGFDDKCRIATEEDIKVISEYGGVL
jgi:hypothetical protein